jgi:hypothetical protein
MTTRSASFIVALTVASTCLTSAAMAQDPDQDQDPVATAATAEPLPLTVTYELTIDEVPEALRASVLALTQAEFEALAATHNLELAAAEQPPDLFLRATVSRPEGQSSVFLISSSVEFEGRTISERREDVCLRCTPPEVASESLVLLPEAAEQVRKARADAAPPAPDPSIEEPANEPIIAKRVAPLGPVGYVGIASSALGLGAAIAGSVVLHRGVIVTSEPGAIVIDSIDNRPVGVALVGAGLGVMVVGNVLLALDLSVLHKRRAATAARLTSVGLTTNNGAGVSFHGRF